MAAKKRIVKRAPRTRIPGPLMKLLEDSFAAQDRGEGLVIAVAMATVLQVRGNVGNFVFVGHSLREDLNLRTTNGMAPERVVLLLVKNAIEQRLAESDASLNGKGRVWS